MIIGSVAKPSLVVFSLSRATRVMSSKSLLPGLTKALPQTSNLIGGRVRFYKHVDVEHFPAEANDEADLYGIRLDGRRLKTVQMNNLLVPSEDLAWGIANEWDHQTDKQRGLQPATMPLTILASKAIDQISVDPTLAHSTILGYLSTDSTLFYTNEQDRILLAKQKELLEPIVDYINDELKINIAKVTGGIIPNKIKHDDGTFNVMKALVHSLDPHTLACLQTVTMECKSIILGMAYVLFNKLTVEQCRLASRVEEEFQIELWGVVEGGHDMDRLNNAVNLSAAGLYMGLLRSGLANNSIGKKK